MAEDLWSAMRRAAEEAIAYRQRIDFAERTPVASPAQMFAAFDQPVPEQGGAPDAIIADLIERATPGLRAMTNARFFGWVIGNSHPIGVAADFLTSAWGQNNGNAFATPAAAAVEAEVARWVLDLLGLPAQCSVGLVTGATVANFVGLAAGRSEVLRRAGWDVEGDGLFGAPPVNVLIGADAHATVYSALRYLGLGTKRVIEVETDERGQIKASAFERALKQASGPTLAVLQAGQLNTGGFDPFAEIVPLARAHGAWTHVDGAFGLWAQAAPQRRHLSAGVEQCDSWATDGHKWLQTPYDCGFAIIRDAEAHRRAMAISASYLPPADDDQRDPSSFVPELSRRARAFPAWAVIRFLGRDGIAELVERNCRQAAMLADLLDGSDGISAPIRPELNQLMLRFGDDDQATLATIDALQRDARLFAGPAMWRGQWAMRISVCSHATSDEDITITAAAIREVWQSVRNAGGQ
ncbi:MAG: aminotransferase class V-fold PLP-dependent enzyme [Sphingomicrobium sp.]